MKPRTRIQKEVVRLSSGLPELTDKQKAYAFEHCFKHHAYRTKGGTITCSECGHRWKGGHTLAETICGCSCPHCGKELEILDTRKRVFRDSAYYEIITTRKGYQVLRYFMVGATYKVGQKAEYSIREVVQWWIAPNGKTEVIARLRAMHTMYYDLWTEWSDMDLRSNKMLKAYNIDAYKTYPAMRIIPELRRNGFKGAFHELTPYEFFTNEQFKPTENILACCTEARNASNVCPDNVRPPISDTVTDNMIGTSMPVIFMACSAAKIAALAFRVSKIVSIRMASTPPSSIASICC